MEPSLSFDLKLLEMNLTNIQELWALGGTERASRARCGAQEMAGLYFSIIACRCFLE